MSKKFQKKKEDFICQNCGAENFGNGYTNHCSECFFSKHVDLNVGDRLNECGGLMEVSDYKVVKGKYILTHKCLKCGQKVNDKFREGVDNFDNFLEIVQKINSKKEI
ncbi:hypothetical protein CSB11_01925 [Candidatus Campbellbacteria bacterium]|nr:MAG: hypothetical protein CSB11_01925 [Candidatus Campbellbacteria bacterium]